MNSRRSDPRKLLRIALATILSAILLPAAQAQVVRLPAVAPPEASPWPAQQTLYPAEMPNVFTPPGEAVMPEPLVPQPAFEPPSPPATPAAEKPNLPPGARAGMFQKAIFDGTWLPRTGGGGMGVSDLEAKAVLAVPCPTPDSPLLIIPGFAAHLFDGPSHVDMPPRLYDAYVQFRWLHRFTPAWACDLSFTPNEATDFDGSHPGAFRPTGYGAAAWTWNSNIQLVLGAGYFNRLTVGWLPIGGIIWTPNDDIRYEMLFPQPKLAHRIRTSGETGDALQNWAYLGAEFGGGAWAFEDEHGRSNVVDYRDYRLLLGWERKVIGALTSRLEIGYVFGRNIQYQRGHDNFQPNDTLMLRGGLSY